MRVAVVLLACLVALASTQTPQEKELIDWITNLIHSAVKTLPTTTAKPPNPVKPTQKPPPATQKPPPATQKPPPATQKPPPATHKPPPATQKPPPTTQKPPQTTQKPPQTTHKPAPATQKPPPTTQKPPQTTQKPRPTTPKPRPTTPKPPQTTQKPGKNCPSCKCGAANVKSRIIGGLETKTLEFPWMAHLVHNGTIICGGSVINDLYVLTAAHCVARLSEKELSVKLHEANRSAANETKPIRKVVAIIKHTWYTPSTNDNDIALLKLDKRVGLGKPKRRVKNDDSSLPGVQSVCLPPYGGTFSQFKGILIGWGAAVDGASLANKLTQVTVPILSNADCQKTGLKGKITNNMLCAGVPEGRHDSCRGEDGGPLHVFNRFIGKNPSESYQQVGVVSWGEGCARPNYPAVYARVNRYLTWIKFNTQDACYCS